MTVTTSKYNSLVKTLSRPLPVWVNEDDDALRVAAYDGYLDMYRNVPETFKLVWRGEEDHPIYVPSSKRIIEATNRYLGKDWSWTITSASTNAADVAAATAALAALFVREEMQAKYYSWKRNSLVKGDAVLHITFDASAPDGQRINIHEIDARNFFRIPQATNVEKLQGCYIVDLVFADDGKTFIARRLEYRYNDNGTVHTQLTFWEQGGWDDRWVGHPPLKPAEAPEAYNTPELSPLMSGFDLPPGVTSLPVYHIRNAREGGEPFGTSELAGLETIIAGVNQGASDEDIILALQGIGVYTTDSTRPTNEQGEEQDWVISPGMVLELATGTSLNRVSGVSSVAPYQDHLGYLGAKMDESAGLSKVAIGNVDIQVAQSGVALRLDMAPILAKNAEKEEELRNKLDQFAHDLLFMWMPLDGFTPAQDIVVSNSFGDPLPKDRTGIITEVTTLVTAGLMSKAFAVQYLNQQLGYNFPPDMLDQVNTEADAVASRMAAELGAQPPGTTPTPGGQGNLTGAAAGGA
jgi:hypothetical protein